MVAFEPDARNLRYLHDHVRLNGVKNVTVYEAAVWDNEEKMNFDDTSGRHQSRVAESGRLQVRTITLDGLILSGEIPPSNFLKVDAEGSEVRVLLGARELLSCHHPTIFLSSHGEKLRAECSSFLTGLGYSLTEIDEPNEMLAVFRRE